ncbi:unnamed protein product [Lactuca virosa]|uniref:DUF4216 domain-containing protein n=1 Tax=Lactuca virosa TaxID=75947 RepID=A0AAU9PIV9_9ASTR|nr:unnamed protein product [Lactuca virosa]
MEGQRGQAINKEIKWLARGPLNNVQRYSGYLVKRYQFHTMKREKFLKTQNSGVVVTVHGASYASSRSPIEGVVNYYGKLNHIIELNYSGFIRVVLFKCDWVDINRGCKKDDSVTLMNFSYKAYTGTNLMDDPFILASQADTVFYGIDPKHKYWEVVRHVKVRDLFGMGGDDAQVVGNPYNDTFDVPNMNRIRDEGDDGMDVTPEMVAQMVDQDVDSKEFEDD